MQRFIFSILLGLAALGIAAALMIPPIAQPLWYHDFADKRSLLGVPNFFNVVSNFSFLFVGAWGIWYSASEKPTDRLRDSSERWMWSFFSAAVALTAVGSAYYHLDPNNDRLVWDRLPIAMTFMALLAIVIAAGLSRRAGTLLFLPLVLLGAATIFYWHLTENWGRGDLRPYLLIQFYPIVASAVILWLCPAQYEGIGKLYSALAWYAGAKLYEFLDKDVFALGQIISGHTLKHIGAAVSCYLILRWIRSSARAPIQLVARSQ